ncbi:2-hydroxy-3-oxopropionate reductase [Rubrobacter xylanophilus]|uniref:2-hydroxy-3-oxopropionate reductase n=1 Tax=Rubrobacter xylanophilus TaxID=49319 RepID=A0A510HIV2_9ACTN|nr:2-hydroxy-3-oxopropionate reductase [Rubrobacter xylanophilus]BBL79195.1 2-hydroxy-3-oxopropionate reductase [Rubrobacter xylanophilus]
MKVGFVGLGIMGWPMAENLVQAGYDLTVHNRTQKKAEEFAKKTGAQLAHSPKEVAESSDVVITMLPGPPEVEEVFLGEGGLIEGADTGTLLIDMSTSSPMLARKIAEVVREQGASALDAPVSGGDVGAREGTLSIMVGGEEEDFERARPLFEAMGKTITHVGPSGAGQVVKAANQIVVALSIEAVSEALVLGSRGGVAPEKILDVLSGGLAGNRVMEVKREKFLSRSFEPGGKARYHRKDLRIALESGREYGVALPATALVEQFFGALEARGDGDLDHSALLRLIESLTGS